jgi:hypothetical protein
MSSSTATADSQKISARQNSASRTSPRTKYLIGYNLVSAGLWTVILHRVVSHSGLKGEPETLYNVVGDFARWSQTLALVEIVHSLFGECFISFYFFFLKKKKPAARESYIYNHELPVGMDN